MINKTTISWIGMLFFLFLIFSLSACENEKTQEKIYYENGQLKYIANMKNGKYDGLFVEYFPEGNLKEKHIYKSGKLVDSSIYYYPDYNNHIETIKYYFGESTKAKMFYPNGNIQSSGNVINDSLSTGKWKYYDKVGNLKEIREYIFIDSVQYLNQRWYLNKNGDTLYGGNHYRIDIANDTISIDEPLQAVAYLYVPLFEKKGSEAILLLNKQHTPFNKNFANESEVELDTFYNLNYDKKNLPIFPENNPNYTIVFGKWFENPGKKIIRGYILEYYTASPNSKDSIRRVEHRMYFDKTIYVQDTLNKDNLNR